ncbi:hypothetical protein [Niastella sp. OAS944]|uniref:hypothetical protein n=1 Tax=Niastella sp. OAS944 TaxID=2664089 RepID=UPI00346FCF23|nr:hypothetical protein [Chitinophagaceae bacterium OAS944]
MKKSISLILGGLLLFGFGCRKIEVDGDGTGNGGGTSEGTILSGKISSDRTLKASNTYTLRGLVYVTDGATLTIEPGTKIVGEKTSRGALIVTRGCKIIANGTADKPILFTSDQANPQRGDWAGIVLMGRARTNASYNGTYGLGEAEGGINDGSGNGLFGGTDDADNSGSLKYVRIEYGGYAFLPDKELNGLGLYALGTGTTIDYVQVSYANDDSFECFGGTVNLTHLISYKGLDDDLDTDNGYSGKVQFVIVQRDSSVADVSGSNGWESDNDVNGSAVSMPSPLTKPLPQTSAVYSNVTLIGPRATSAYVGNSLFKNAAQIRRNSAISIFNSVIMGWPTGLLLDAQTGRAVDANITTDNSLQIQYVTIAGCNTPLKYTLANPATGWTQANMDTWFRTTSPGNSILDLTTDVKLTDPFNHTGSPDYTPQAGSPLLGSADFNNSKLAGFTQVTYRGAVGTGDTWWKGWTKF